MWEKLVPCMQGFVYVNLLSGCYSLALYSVLNKGFESDIIIQGRSLLHYSSHFLTLSVFWASEIDTGSKSDGSSHPANSYRACSGLPPK